LSTKSSVGPKLAILLGPEPAPPGWSNTALCEWASGIACWILVSPQTLDMPRRACSL